MSQKNDAYAAALAEIEEGRLDKGAWARAFADSGGDESKAKAFYIKARAESTNASPAWSDTQPPIEDVLKKRVGPGNGKDTPDNQPVDFYETAIGEKNLDYYIGKFHAFDEKGPGLHASWNWAAFFFTGFWSLYRKMYVWFFAWWAVGTVLTVFSKVQNSEINQILGIVVGILWIAFTLYANALYHRKIEARIATARKTTSDTALVKKRLSAGSGVNVWAAYVFGAIPVIGIVAAVALPAYQDYSKRREVAATPAQVPPLEVTDWDKGVIVAPTTQVNATPSPSVASPYTHGNPVETTSTGPIARVDPPLVPEYQRKEALEFEAQQRVKKAKIEADLKEVSERALRDYPYLDTPAGEEDLKKIITKRDEMIQQGVYPSLALTRAVLAVAAYRERQPAQEVRKVKSEQYQSSPETMKNTATEVDAPKSVQPTPPQSDSYVQKVRGLQAAVQRGEIPSMNGVVSFWQPTNPAQWLSSDAAVLESTQTWWQENSNDFLIHVKNTTANPLAMLGIDYNRGACNSNGAKTRFYLTPSRRITPGSQAIVNFKIELPVSAQTKGCLVISSAWR